MSKQQPPEGMRYDEHTHQWILDGQAQKSDSEKPAKEKQPSQKPAIQNSQKD